MTAYHVLQCESNHTFETIKSQYRKLVLKHHPDKGGDATTFRRIQEAFETIQKSFKLCEICKKVTSKHSVCDSCYHQRKLCTLCGLYKNLNVENKCKSCELKIHCKVCGKLCNKTNPDMLCLVCDIISTVCKLCKLRGVCGKQDICSDCEKIYVSCVNCHVNTPQINITNRMCEVCFKFYGGFPKKHADTYKKPKRFPDETMYTPGKKFNSTSSTEFDNTTKDETMEDMDTTEDNTADDMDATEDNTTENDRTENKSQGSKRKMKCSICGECGHNKRTCKQKKEI